MTSFFGYLQISLAIGNQPQHLHLPFGKAVGVGGALHRLGLNPFQPLGYPRHQGAHTQIGGNR